MELEDSPHNDAFFLGWVRLYLMGCTPLEVRDAVRASCESGAIREPELHRDTTHILVRAETGWEREWARGHACMKLLNRFELGKV